MGRKAVRTPRVTRREKLMQERIESLKGSPLIQSPQARQMPRLEAKNQSQKTALRYLAERDIVLLTGSAGTGKSMLAAFHAATKLQGKAVENVYLVRPAVPVGKSIGLLPGDIKEKLLPYFKQTIKHLESFLGKGMVTYSMEKGVIEMFPVEYLRGVSFENCIVICEEAQNLTHEDMEMMLTRLGDNCQIIFTGDTKQNDLRTVSGLKTTTDMIRKMLDEEPDYLGDDDLDLIDSGVGIVQFTPDDVVRHGLTRAFVRMYYHATP